MRSHDLHVPSCDDRHGGHNPNLRNKDDSIPSKQVGPSPNNYSPTRDHTNPTYNPNNYGTTNDGKHIATATDATKTYTLGTLLANNALDPDGSTPKSRRIIELSLPVETNCLMFWGKAPKTGTDAEQGKISFTATNKDLTQHAFSLQPVINGNTAAVRQYEELLLAILNDLGNVKYEAAANALVWTAADGGDGSKNADPISISWADYSSGNQSTSSSSLAVAATCPLESVTPADGPALSGTRPEDRQE